MTVSQAKPFRDWFVTLVDRDFERERKIFTRRHDCCDREERYKSDRDTEPGGQFAELHNLSRQLRPPSRRPAEPGGMIGDHRSRKQGRNNCAAEFSIPARHRAALPAQVHCKIALHDRRRVERHGMERREPFRHEASAVALHLAGRLRSWTGDSRTDCA